MLELHRFGQQMTHFMLKIAQKNKIIRISEICQFHPVQQMSTNVWYFVHGPWRKSPIKIVIGIPI